MHRPITTIYLLVALSLICITLSHAQISPVPVGTKIDPIAPIAINTMIASCTQSHTPDSNSTHKCMINSINLPRINVNKIKVKEFTAHGDNTYEDSIDIYNFTDYHLEGLIRWVCDYLDIRNVWINLTYTHKESFFLGMVEPSQIMLNNKWGYNIYLKRNLNKRDLGLAVIHELIHVKQYESGELKLYPNARLATFNGEKINLKKIPYNMRRYEVEAHTKDIKIFNAYRQR